MNQDICTIEQGELCVCDPCFDRFTSGHSDVEYMEYSSHLQKTTRIIGASLMSAVAIFAGGNYALQEAQDFAENTAESITCAAQSLYMHPNTYQCDKSD